MVEGVRVNHERSVIVQGLNQQIKELRSIIYKQRSSLTKMESNQKASHLMELSIEKEEYYNEVCIVREVLIAPLHLLHLHHLLNCFNVIF